jgi:phosphatidylglycerophosphatase A
MDGTNHPQGENGSFSRRATLVLATGFGLGYSPVASGTAGTLPGVLLALALARLSVGPAVAVAIALAALAIPLCHRAERLLGHKDDGRIVADEFLTFPLCVLGLPIAEFPLLLVPAFLAHRFFDILKPPPAWQAQKIAGGAGIVLDDVASSLYALAFNHAFWLIWQKLFL